MYSASYDGGKTWTTPYELTTGVMGAQGKNPAIAEDSEGNLVVTWRGAPEEAVYTQVSRDSGRSWSAPQRILGASYGGAPSTVVSWTPTPWRPTAPALYIW